MKKNYKGPYAFIVEIKYWWWKWHFETT